MTKIISTYSKIQELLFAKKIYVQIILTILYIVGLIGFIWIPNYFLKLTPLFLLLNFIVLALFQTHRTVTIVRFGLLIFVCGFAIEMIGVTTGHIFGFYQYGNGLGFKLKETPLIIGLNWLILTYTTAQISIHSLPKKSIYLQSLIGASLMLSIDIFIEMVAPKLDFWTFEEGFVPPQNYIAWFVISFFFNLAYHTIEFKSKNKMAQTVFVLQFLFFTFLSFALSDIRNHELENKEKTLLGRHYKEF
jgi:putative membrane protein